MPHSDAVMQMADAQARRVEEELGMYCSGYGADACAVGCRDGVDGHVDATAGAGAVRCVQDGYGYGIAASEVSSLGASVVGAYDGARP